MEVEENLQTRRNLNRSLKKDKVETQNYVVKECALLEKQSVQRS